MSSPDIVARMKPIAARVAAGESAVSALFAAGFTGREIADNLDAAVVPAPPSDTVPDPEAGERLRGIAASAALILSLSKDLTMAGAEECLSPPLFSTIGRGL